MTALGLKQVVEEALARVGIDINQIRIPRGKPRTKSWIKIEECCIRHYATGRNVYVVQTRMGGKLRTVTLGPASALTGCRRGEILGLRWQDVHGIRLKLRHGKTGPRMVWMGDDARTVWDTCPRCKEVLWVF
jgi:integrase